MVLVRRRPFVRALGRGSVAVFVLGVAACATDAEEPGAAEEGTGPETPATGATDATTGTTTGATTSGAGRARWVRVNLGFVSAYVVVRGGEGAVIDTGVEESEERIGQVLEEAGSRWDDVSHVFVTHSHPDHMGSLAAVMGLAAGAEAFAGAADIPAMSSPRPVTGVADGDTRFGLDVIATPGHTPGHISLLDRSLDVLFAGDAMNGVDGGVAGANPEFTADMAMADESVRKLAGFTFDDIVFGHGEPVRGEASTQVDEFVSTEL